MNFFRKIFKYIDELDYGVFQFGTLMICLVIALGYGVVTSRIPVKVALLSGLEVIVVVVIFVFVGKFIGRKIKKINRKKELEDLKRFKRFKYD